MTDWAAPEDLHSPSARATDLVAHIRLDRRANPRDPKAQTILSLLRLTQFLKSRNGKLLGLVAEYGYRFVTEFILGVELRPKTRVGRGITIYHGVGLVVNDHAVIGDGVILRNGVTIGHKARGGPSPVIGDRVEFGAGAIVLGGVDIGHGSVIGAGAVVLQSCPPESTLVGNPARRIH